MGFLNFFQKKKEDSSSIPEPPMNDLDIPPTPPKIEVGNDEGIAIPPTPETTNDLPDFPEISSSPSDSNMSFFDVEEEKAQPANVEAKVQEKIAIEPPKEEIPKLEPREYNHNKPLYIKADNFQRILGRILTSKEALKICEEKLYAVSEVKAKEDVKMKLWKNKLEDIQRKIIYVDKTLFENEG
jgi:hypothetical protein